ncbi:HD domain-containing phosphohydrolase [Shumkonia mesophila]|uniref:HD domain-containing phosphohydrolase n=1 Tax=Shumkonia mesophila TaxID=2838854 RepID=UPI0029344391|nr:HD domain-containing phosphohydrolase [Shumkonia mesophila]
MLPEILIADDEPDIRLVFALVFRRRGWICHEAATASDTIQAVRTNPNIGIIFIDIHMPGETGLQCMERIKGENADRNLEFVIITGNAGVQEAVSALRLGAADFLTKPIRSKQVWETLEKCHQRFRQREDQRALKKGILAEIGSKDSRILNLVHEIDAARIESLETLAIAAEHRDNETGAHIRRIGAYARVLAEGLGWQREGVEQVGMAAQLHDIGKVGVPDRVLLKPGPLTAQEWATMKKHTEIGGRIIGVSKGDAMQCAARIALSHHERWDGSGYPYGLSGAVIPIEARIVAVCDVYDALRSRRPYKPAIEHREVVATILEGDGRTRPEHFDPDILNLFARKASRFAELYDRHPDTAEGEAGHGFAAA